MTSSEDPAWLATALLPWFDRFGRKDLPWQRERTPYRVWVSEIMLQQTQVATVIGYYERFLARFPSVAALASAPIDEVLHLWTGLGYYARARNLHRAAQQVVTEFNGELPTGVDALTTLPGIGRSTAGAIAAISQGQHAVILDGNVKRVLTRFHAIAGYPGTTAVSTTLWTLAEAHTPPERTADYTQAIMDLGATLCVRRKPACDACPLAARCQARALDRPEDFPGRKPRKEKPVRAARVWLILDPKDRLLLEQRPPSGIWGGLWTPPETAADTTLSTLAAQLDWLEGELVETEPLTPFRHTFTHYHLELDPRTVRFSPSRRTAGVAEEERFCWYDRGAAPALGLSAPTVRLLEALAAPQQLALAPADR
ncbi:MAG: A/G-specific adenine glycosylase [Pseudomonadota bacterium]